MLVLWACLVAVAAASPARYNQRQDGEMNVRADVQNVVFIVAIPQKLPFSLDILDTLLKSAKTTNAAPEIQDRADHLESFLEPSTPYHVEISGDASGTPAPDVKPVIGNRYVAEEVVIDGRRSHKEVLAGDGLKLLGATEQCGPGRARDHEGICRDAPESPPEHDTVPDPKQADHATPGH